MCHDCRKTETGRILWDAAETDKSERGETFGAMYKLWHAYHNLWVLEQMRASGRKGGTVVAFLDPRPESGESSEVVQQRLPPSEQRWFRGVFKLYAHLPRNRHDPLEYSVLTIELTAPGEPDDEEGDPTGQLDAMLKMHGWLKEAFEALRVEFRTGKPANPVGVVNGWMIVSCEEVEHR